MSVEITKCTIEDLESSPNFVGLVDEYAMESAVLGLPRPSGKIELYKTIEHTKMLQAFSARLDNILVGFAVVLSPTNLHYGFCLATVESIFVGKAYRSTGAGLKLIRAVEQEARAVKSPGLLMSAPMGSDLADVLPRMDYEETNRVFFKNFEKKQFPSKRIEAMSKEAISNVYRLQEFTKKMPQIPIATGHTLHGGMYARTIMLPAGVMLTGALIKIATTLILSGDVIVYLDGEATELRGYNVFAAAANRKQAFIARTDTYMTMLFPTEAKNVHDAEEQFTDEADLLFSRHVDAQNYLTAEV